ncbi:DctQ component [Vibrio sp. B1FLJ16]|nr:DctQ component [Vibrio sp. B1FLJ16]CAE6936427.1 DctQ component [Vibrio sp. B1FLJ16]
MTVLKNFINRISYTMHTCSGVLLIGMMLVTLVDVVTRTLYGLSDGNIAFTFIGGVELIKYGLLFTVLFTLPSLSVTLRLSLTSLPSRCLREPKSI